MKILFDGDILAFKAASVSEQRSIEVVHKASGNIKEFQNREAFYYRKNKIGGFLGEVNKGRENPFTLDDFEIRDIQTAVPERECLKTLDSMLNNMLKAMNYCEFTDTYGGYLGRGDTFRHDLATLLPYKGNRGDIKPVHLDACKKHLAKKHKLVFSDGIEADDDLAIEQVQGYLRWKETQEDDDKVVVVTTDKDAKGQCGWLYNPDKDKEPWLIEGLGELLINDKGDVDGYGRIWAYYQIIAGDQVDNYRLSCHSDKKFGSVAAYKALKDCKDDKECWLTMIDAAKKLYPKPKTITNWKGDKVKIDWFYVLNEQAQLALMLPHRDFRYDLKTILKNIGVKL